MPTPPRLTWDIFCHVIDNWGDLGVCWRLARQLLHSGQHVRLWVDDATPLQWMASAPDAPNGLEVHPWAPHEPEAPAPRCTPGDVLIEAFGCDIQPHWVQALQPEATSATGQRVWLNLEYLSAESYVERCHLLPSPVWSGPLEGRQKWFFYPGFTPTTGGLLREPDLLARQAAFDPTAWRLKQAPHGHAPLWASLFCYEPAALPELLRMTGPGVHWLVTPGRAQAAFEAAFAHAAQTLPQAKAPGHTPLPPLPQDEFDHLLWACDLNFVRGEDSLVRALWAGQPFVWHIYPQEDNAHHAKLNAFLDWMDAPASLRAFHHVWNGMKPGPLPELLLHEWAICAQQARQRLLLQTDLVAQLLDFVAGKR